MTAKSSNSALGDLGDLARDIGMRYFSRAHKEMIEDLMSTELIIRRLVK